MTEQQNSWDKNRMVNMKKISKKNAKKMLKEYSRGRIFVDYSREANEQRD
ncbi:hypothetical protein [Brevibacillus laterosporus]|nr:hypothetical protein [Brevibacillus laterosporus]